MTSSVPKASFCWRVKALPVDFFRGHLRQDLFQLCSAEIDDRRRTHAAAARVDTSG